MSKTPAEIFKPFLTGPMTAADYLAAHNDATTSNIFSPQAMLTEKGPGAKSSTGNLTETEDTTLNK